MKKPNEIKTYFWKERKILIIVTISGIFYNIGLLAGPWFEGQLAQCLLDIFNQHKVWQDMLRLVIGYVAAIFLVQIARYIKRLYVRKFANEVNLEMKHTIYQNLVNLTKTELEKENVGSMMTKAISDVDACVEGMRKFTTEIFDTGIAMIGYVALLVYYDWKLALMCLIFPPISYYIAEKMKVVVQKSSAAYKKSAGRLNERTLDRVSLAMTYRVFGIEKKRDEDYEKYLKDYESKAIMANIWTSAMPPIYRTISNISVLLIIYFGSQNVSLGQWNIAMFTTFLACFLKLSLKSSKAAKLFNAVHKAEVSWQRIKPLMKEVEEEKELESQTSSHLRVEKLSVLPLFENVSFGAKPGEIIGVTGPVACGKSTLGKTFLCEQEQSGQIYFNYEVLTPKNVSSVVGYLGHDLELQNDSIKENILLGKKEDVNQWIQAVCLDEDHLNIEAVIGSSGVMLSGGQQARVALARTLAHPKPILVLDDPFAALDRKTEEKVFKHLKEIAKNQIVILITHRLYVFNQTSQVIWMNQGQTIVSTHQELMKNCLEYKNLYETQCKEGDNDEK